MQPWWARVLALAQRRVPALRNRPAAWLIVVEAAFTNALCLRRGQCTGVRAQWLGSPCPQALAELAARLPAVADRDDAVVLALGHGLGSGPVPGVEVLGRLDEAGPSPDWLLAREARA